MRCYFASIKDNQAVSCFMLHVVSCARSLLNSWSTCAGRRGWGGGGTRSHSAPVCGGSVPGEQRWCRVLCYARCDCVKPAILDYVDKVNMCSQLYRPAKFFALWFQYIICTCICRDLIVCFFFSKGWVL